MYVKHHYILYRQGMEGQCNVRNFYYGAELKPDEHEPIGWEKLKQPHCGFRAGTFVLTTESGLQ